MTIGLPISFSFQSSNVTDDTSTLADVTYGCNAPIFEKGLEIRADDWIWEYAGETDYTVRKYSITDANGGDYEIGDVLLKDCGLVKVTGKSGTGIVRKQRPKEPEEYGVYDLSTNGILDPSTFTNRYFRVSNNSKDGWLSKMWRSPSGKRWYYMFWEARGFGGCGSGAWRWSAKDLNANVGERNIRWYLRSCLRGGHSQKFDASKDIKATVHNWGSVDCSGGCPKEATLMFKSVVERNGYFYFRTHINAPIKYATFSTGSEFNYTFSAVVTPADIEGFTKKRRTSEHNPFDGKNYTKAKFTPPSNKAVWTMVASEPFDSIAFGKVVCDSIDVRAITEDGEVTLELNNYIVQNTVSSSSQREFPSTVIMYTGRNEDGSVRLLPSETIIEITLHGSDVEIGEIIGAETLDAGFTKSNFKNNFKDFSPKEQNQWGSWFYTDGIRVSLHTGTVEFPILSYDGLNRLMLLIGGRKVIINSSDSLGNETPDGRHVFEATMMIARFLNFDLSSSEKNKRIGEKGSYTFKIEELV